MREGVRCRKFNVTPEALLTARLLQYTFCLGNEVCIYIYIYIYMYIYTVFNNPTCSNKTGNFDSFPHSHCTCTNTNTLRQVEASQYITLYSISNVELKGTCQERAGKLSSNI